MLKILTIPNQLPCTVWLGINVYVCIILITEGPADTKLIPDKLVVVVPYGLH